MKASKPMYTSSIRPGLVQLLSLMMDNYSACFWHTFQSLSFLLFGRRERGGIIHAVVKTKGPN